MLLNLLLLVLTSVAAVGGSVNVMENYEEHPDVPEEEKEEFYQYVKEQEQKKEEFQNMNSSNVGLQMEGNVGAESFQAQVAPNANVSNVVTESFQAQVANASMNNVSSQANASNAPTLEGFTGGSFAAF